jgi:hypothetical protein
MLHDVPDRPSSGCSTLCRPRPSCVEEPLHPGTNHRSAMYNRAGVAHVAGIANSGRSRVLVAEVAAKAVGMGVDTNMAPLPRSHVRLARRI